MEAPEQPPSPPPLPPPISRPPAHNSFLHQLGAAALQALSVGTNKAVSATATSAYRLTSRNPELGGGKHGHAVEGVTAAEDRVTKTASLPGNLAFLRNRNAVLAGCASDSYSDYVIDFRFPIKPAAGFIRRHPEIRWADGSNSRATYQKYVQNAYANVVSRLTRAGLTVEVCRVDCGRLFLFVTCTTRRLGKEALRSRVNDFLWGVRGACFKIGHANDDLVDQVITKAPLTTSERLRLVYGIITNSSRYGGAGVIPRETEFVDAVFPLHDRKLNKAWIRNWSLKWILDQNDLNMLRDQYGEQVGYYFAFLQCYLMWLIVPAVVELPLYLSGNYFSVTHGIFTVVWSTLFVAYWRRRERELAVLWDVRETSRVEHPRPGFVSQSETIDPVTNEKVPYYPLWKRHLRQAATFPLVIGIGSLLMLLIGSIFAFEVFMTEFYRGPGLAFLVYSPTVIYSALVPAASSLYFKFARRLTTFENHETETKDDASLSQKVFVFTFMASYLSIFLTAYVYIPFSGDFENWLRREGQIYTNHAVVGRDRVVGQLIYFVLAGQVINFANEVIVPYFARLGQKKVRRIVSSRAARKNDQQERRRYNSVEASSTDEGGDDEQATFLKKVQSEADKPDYDLYADFSEMITQFGYVSMFSLGWPITPLICLVNNWIELRSDAVKICIHTRRPVPKRTDTIGPWLDNLDRLTWLASITNITLSLMYHDFDPPKNQLPPILHLLLATLAAEHAFFAVKYLIERSLGQVPSPVDAIARKNDYEIKRRYVPDAQATFPATPTQTAGENATYFVGKRGSSAHPGALVEGINQIQSEIKRD